MLINVSDVLSNEGKVVQVPVEIELNSFESRLGKYKIIKKNPMKLTITNIGKKEIQICGTTYLTVGIPCGRCLEEVPTDLTIIIGRNVDMNLSEEEWISKLDDSSYLAGNDLDVDKLIYNEILVNWPMKVLCNADCKGICNRCGTNRNVSTCDCDITDLDPRMAAISDIFNKFKEV